jgi:hypothetical protein
MNHYYKEYIKQSTIAIIQTLADKIEGRESAYENLNKLCLFELEQIRDGHIIAYNDMLKSQGKVDGFLSV